MPAPLDRLIHPVDVSPFQPAPPPPAQLEDHSTQPASPIVPYKRVPKACTQCRHDKTRCDKARPCNGCVKRGRAHLCLDGCVACRKARLRCDGNRPCANCAVQGLECIEDDPVAIAAAHARKSQRLKALAASTTRLPTAHSPPVESPSSTTSTSTTTPKSRNHSNNRSTDGRIKLACLACRRDNKKCPGGRPCPRCMNSDEECVYVARAPKLVKQRCALCRKKNKKCEEARPCAHCVKAEVECVDLPRKGTGPGLRVKRACMGCRADKIQCEEARPCAGCKKKGVPCIARECKGCVESGTKCSSCVRQMRFHLDPSPSEESDSDWEGLSTPSIRSPSSSTHRLDHRTNNKPTLTIPTPLQHNYHYSLPQTHNPLYAPLPAPSFSSRTFPSSPSMHPMRPNPYPLTYSADNSLFFYTDSPRSLSLGVSMSDERTRPAHFTDE